MNTDYTAITAALILAMVAIVGLLGTMLLQRGHVRMGHTLLASAGFALLGTVAVVAILAP